MILSYHRLSVPRAGPIEALTVWLHRERETLVMAGDIFMKLNLSRRQNTALFFAASQGETARFAGYPYSPAVSGTTPLISLPEDTGDSAETIRPEYGSKIN